MNDNIGFKSALEFIKGLISALSATISTALGGYDSLLSFLTLLMITDVITGITNAIIKKEVSSKEMRNGIVRKLCVFLLVSIAYQGDSVLIDKLNHPLTIGGNVFYFRTIMICYFILEEFISVLENFANIGLPIPKWLRVILKQVNETAQNSTPQMLIDFVKEKFNITINKDGTIAGSVSDNARGSVEKTIPQSENLESSVSKSDLNNEKNTCVNSEDNKSDNTSNPP